MKKEDLIYICKTLSGLSGVPVRAYEDDEEIYRSAPFLPKDPALLYEKEIGDMGEHVGYFVTPEFYVYGTVNSGNTRIVAGPTSQVPAKDRTLRELAFRCDVQKDDVPAFMRGMKSIGALPLESLIMMLLPVNYMLNGEKLELKDVAIKDSAQEYIKKKVERGRTERVYEEEPRQTTLHNTLQIEETLMNIVRKGDTASLRQWLSSAPAVRGGEIAADQLRQLKNTLIVTATLVSRAAVRGGMDVDEAFTLSDAYIRRCEELDSQTRIVNLQYNMILEFTEQVEKIRRGKNPSKLQTDVANYVQRHLSEAVSTEEMAKEFFMSRPYLSTRFKAETGMTLTDFILNEKTEEAKRLLRYSDKSAASIAAYLGFSSHGHFCKVFRKYAGATPKEYRDRFI